MAPAPARPPHAEQVDDVVEIAGDDAVGEVTNAVAGEARVGDRQREEEERTRTAAAPSRERPSAPQRRASCGAPDRRRQC